MADSSEKAFPLNNPRSADTNPLVPFVDLKAQYQTIKSEIEAAISRVVESGRYILGPEVEKFEKDFAKYVGARFCVGVNSGTAALQLALMATGVGATDEVIVPANTFFATAETVSTAGARPVFVDADSVAYTIDVSKIENAITPRTRAIIPVHLYGQPADLDPVFEIARRHNLSVIEDAAQAHGAEYKGRKVGALGDVGCFSFYPGKNLGAFGEAGAIVTDNVELQEKIRILRDHGQVRKYRHTMIGWNCRMDGIQAAVLSVKLQYLERGNLLRRVHALQYSRAFQGVEEVVTPFEAAYARHVYHIYAIRIQERDQVMWLLKEKGIQCGVHYPVPIHLQKAYQSLGYKNGAFPISEQIAKE